MKKPIALTAVLLLGSAAAAQEPLVVSIPIREVTAQATVNFHADRETMVECTEEQIAQIEERVRFHLDALTGVLLARIVSRGDAPGTVLDIELDAACYEGGIAGLAGYGHAGEPVSIPYEEQSGDGEWGPPPPADPMA